MAKKLKELRDGWKYDEEADLYIAPPPPRPFGKWKILITVVESRRDCPRHHVGDVIEFEHDSPQMCGQALLAIWPKIYSMVVDCDFTKFEQGRGGDPNKAYWCCPDADNLVVFEIKRVPLEHKEE